MRSARGSLDAIGKRRYAGHVPTKAVFFTLTCASDYEFLLGSVEHHAELGSQLILDTSPSDKAKRFKNLPDNLIWLHEPDFGSGWKKFKLRSAVDRAMKQARAFNADVVVYRDSDEFFTKDSAELLFPWAERAMVETFTVHWKTDGKPYRFGPSEWHRRLWPSGAGVEIALNVAWTRHPSYDGNPERHPVPVPPPGLQLIRVYGEFHHHVHYAIGPKAVDQSTAISTVDGWPDFGVELPPVPWPERLRLWRDEGILPSESFK